MIVSDLSSNHSCRRPRDSFRIYSRWNGHSIKHYAGTSRL